MRELEPVAGLSRAGYSPQLIVEPDPYAAQTLLAAGLPVFRGDLHTTPKDLGPAGLLDLLYARTTESPDESHDSTPVMLEFASMLRPRALILEARTDALTERYDHYRGRVRSLLAALGYRVLHWAASDGRQYGAVSPWEGFFLVAMRADQPRSFMPSAPTLEKSPTLFSILAESMQQRFAQSLDPRYPYVWKRWAAIAESSFAPRLTDVLDAGEDADALYPDDVYAWRACGIDIRRLASEQNPEGTLLGLDGPCLTLNQAALLRGFPVDWHFVGGSREVFRQIVEATPPVVPHALGRALAEALEDLDAEPLGEPLADELAPPAVDRMAEVDAPHHDDFEGYIADLLERDGYRVEKAGDGGIDVHAAVPLGYPVIVQCKRFQNAKGSVGSPAARNRFGAAPAMHPKPRALLVTNGKFTVECIKWAQEEKRLILVTRERLERWAIDRLPLHKALCLSDWPPIGPAPRVPAERLRGAGLAFPAVVRGCRNYRALEVGR